MFDFGCRLSLVQPLAATNAELHVHPQTGVVSAPLYDSINYRFAGMFTLVDVIHLIQYYYLTATGYDNAALEVEQVDLSALRGAFDALDFSLITTELLTTGSCIISHRHRSSD